MLWPLLASPPAAGNSTSTKSTLSFFSVLTPTSNGDPRLVATSSPGKWVDFRIKAKAPSYHIDISNVRCVRSEQDPTNSRMTALTRAVNVILLSFCDS